MVFSWNSRALPFGSWSCHSTRTIRGESRARPGCGYFEREARSHLVPWGECAAQIFRATSGHGPRPSLLHARATFLSPSEGSVFELDKKRTASVTWCLSLSCPDGMATYPQAVQTQPVQRIRWRSTSIVGFPLVPPRVELFAASQFLVAEAPRSAESARLPFGGHWRFMSRPSSPLRLRI